MLIGNKIKRLRLESGMTQEEIADRCELSKVIFHSLKRSYLALNINFEDILEYLGTSLQQFFGEEVIDEQIVFTNEDYFVKEAADQSYAINWIVPNAKTADGTYNSGD